MTLVTLVTLVASADSGDSGDSGDPGGISCGAVVRQTIYPAAGQPAGYCNHACTDSDVRGGSTGP